MNNGIASISHIRQNMPDFSSIPKWTGVISFVYFLNALIFAAASFLPFVIKRTNGFDSFFISGAYSGTVQLLIFVVLLSAALFSFMLGYYLFKFSSSFKIEEENNSFESLKPAFENLSHFFKTAGIITVVIYAAAIIAVLIRLTDLFF